MVKCPKCEQKITEFDAARVSKCPNCGTVLPKEVKPEVIPKGEKTEPESKVEPEKKKTEKKKKGE